MPIDQNKEEPHQIRRPKQLVLRPCVHSPVPASHGGLEEERPALCASRAARRRFMRGVEGRGGEGVLEHGHGVRRVREARRVQSCLPCPRQERRPVQRGLHLAGVRVPVSTLPLASRIGLVAARLVASSVRRQLSTSA
uniref:Predicted protein n=1 Tax=Hordeum vulgare subsp. vulgare TaxID=112509 RepID=F2EIM9_HORVV|nr:predicted protein [Hordeum vulgare subsp. vulgare]